MDHAAYLDRYESLTSAALSELALLHGKQSWDEATAYLTSLRSQQDALWDEYRQSAGELVNP